MKKFVIFALAVLVAFAMCSCQPTTENLNDSVEFKVSLGAQASKSLSATDPGQDLIDKIQLAFVPVEQRATTTDDGVYINCQYKIGDNTKNDQQSTLTSDEPSNWIDGLITVAHNTDGTVTLTWTEGAQLYLSQGKWSIYARALDANESVLYDGDTTTFVNKKSASARITLTPKATDATGTLLIQSLTASKVFEDIKKEQLVYSYTSLNGSTLPTTQATGTVIAPKTTQTDAEGEDIGTGLVVFNDTTVENLAQGSYILSVILQQDTRADGATSAVWTDYTGGSVVDFGIYKDTTTTITGHVDASDYMATTVGVDIDSALFTLTLTNKNEDTDKVSNGQFALKYEAKITVDGEKAKPANLMWYVDGKLVKNQTISSTDKEITLDVETLTVAHGKHNVQAIVVGYIDGNKTSAYDAKSSLVTEQFDTRGRL